MKSVSRWEFTFYIIFLYTISNLYDLRHSPIYNLLHAPGHTEKLLYHGMLKPSLAICIFSRSSKLMYKYSHFVKK